MSDDFISVLRRDLVEAAARHGRRRPIGRAARRLHARTWRPAVAAGALALAATLAAVVIALSTLAPPVQRAGRLDVLAVVSLGGQPQGAVYGGGSLWVADYDGYVVRVDPEDRRVLARIPSAGSATSIAADDAAVWVVSVAGSDRLLVRIDPRTDRVVSRLSRPISELALGAGGLWTRRWAAHGTEISRVDGARSRGTRVPDGQSLAAGRDSVWALANNGTLTEIDASGNIVHTLPGAASPNTSASIPENAVTADAAGAWAADSEKGTVVHVVAGQVVQRIPVAPFTGPIARTDDAVWVATADALRRRYGLARIDAERETVTATIDLGSHIPRTIVAVGNTVWVIASDGTATIVRDD